MSWNRFIKLVKGSLADRRDVPVESTQELGRDRVLAHPLSDHLGGDILNRREEQRPAHHLHREELRQDALDVLVNRSARRDGREHWAGDVLDRRKRRFNVVDLGAFRAAAAIEASSGPGVLRSLREAARLTYRVNGDSIVDCKIALIGRRDDVALLDHRIAGSLQYVPRPQRLAPVSAPTVRLAPALLTVHPRDGTGRPGQTGLTKAGGARPAAS